MFRLFFIFWIRSNIFCDFSGCRPSILISEVIIRFVCPLAFQCRIPNYSTAKTREDMAKRKRKVANNCLAFLHFLDSFKHISRFLWLQAFDFLMFIYHQICLSISFPTPYSKLFYCKNSQRYSENKTESRKRGLADC